MTIKEDFEKAFKDTQFDYESCLIGAKWMAERCKNEASNSFRIAYDGSDEHAKYCFVKVHNRLEDIAKELQ